MALLANYPIAVAPAMGHNFFFAYSVVVGMQVPWRVALGGVAIAGIVFILTAGIGLRERADHRRSRHSLKHAIAAGIGLLIATIGLQWAGLDRRRAGHAGDARRSAQPPGPAGARRPGADRDPDGAAGSRRVAVGHPGHHRVGLPLASFAIRASPACRRRFRPTFLQLDIAGALAPGMVTVVFVFFFLALFDSVGTLVGVGSRPGLMRDGTLPRARQALLADAIGTVAGAGSGHPP